MQTTDSCDEDAAAALITSVCELPGVGLGVRPPSSCIQPTILPYFVIYVDLGGSGPPSSFSLISTLSDYACLCTWQKSKTTIIEQLTQLARVADESGRARALSGDGAALDCRRAATATRPVAVETEPTVRTTLGTCRAERPWRAPAATGLAVARSTDLARTVVLADRPVLAVRTLYRTQNTDSTGYVTSRPHGTYAVHEMRPIATDVTRSVVCVSVCARHTGELCKNGWTDQDAVWGTDSCGFKKPCVIWGSRSPYGKGQWALLRGQPGHVLATYIRIANGVAVMKIKSNTTNESTSASILVL